MGYLDNSTIVVDAVLTKLGRKLLAQGQGLNIKYFTLTDTGIDYTLWNPDHPSGSAYYGEAIENLPNLEALPSAAYFMRNNLITMERTATALPYVVVDNKGIGESWTATFKGDGSAAELQKNFVLQMGDGQVDSDGWQVIISDATLLKVPAGEGWTQTNIQGNVTTFLNEQEVPEAVVWEGSSEVTAIPLRREDTNSDRSVTVTVISKGTGAYKHGTMTIEKTEVITP